VAWSDRTIEEAQRLEETGSTTPANDGPSHHPHTWWRRLRLAVAAGVLGAAVWFMVAQFQELESAARQLTHVRAGWMALAVAAEAGSMLAFALLQRRLLRASGTKVALLPMTAVTLASNAIDATFPGGVAWAAAWLFNQLGRWGVDRFRRVWMFLVAGGVSSFALFIVVGSGVELAGPHGPVASLRWLVFLLALIPVVALVLELFRDTGTVAALRTWAVRHLDRDVPGGRRILRLICSLVERFTAVRLRPLGWIEVLALALANWLLDCVVVVAALEALDVHVPWSAILVIYGLTQISAAFPLTPGGIGVVAGSLGALLSAYGVPTVDALSTVILYRILTFYILVPMGWGVFGILELRARHHPGPLRVQQMTRPLRGKSRPDQLVALSSGASVPDGQGAAPRTELDQHRRPRPAPPPPIGP
jgi:putative heme transporter